jgi:hypothetical protein
VDIYVASETRIVLRRFVTALMIGSSGGCGFGGGDEYDFVLGETKEKQRDGEKRKEK